jgi:hypothetical protein
MQACHYRKMNEQDFKRAREERRPIGICISVSSVWHKRLQVGEMLRDTFSKMGFAATMVDDGDPAAMTADMLLIAGSSRGSVRYPDLLGSENARPVTILWQLEPLPPCEATKRAEQIGLKLAMCDCNKLPQPYSALVKLVPGHNDLRNLLRWILASRFVNEMPDSVSEEYGRVRPYDLYNVMNEYAWFRRHYSRHWCDIVYAGTLARCRFLVSRGIDARFVPMGYHRYWGEDLRIARDIDVLFLGKLRKNSRLRILRPIMKKLSRQGVVVRTVEKGCYGLERTRLLNRSRILIDLVRLGWDMPVMRLLMAMSCRVLVISNWTHGPSPFSSEHLVQTDTDNIAETVLHYLRHSNERQQIVDSAYTFVTEELTLDNSVRQIMLPIAMNSLHVRNEMDEVSS